LGDERHTSGRGMGEQLGERRRPDRARADLLVPVTQRAARVLRVVRVHEPEAARAGDRDEALEGGGGTARLVERGAGGEDVAGVEADADPGVVVEDVEVRREVVDTGAQGPALAGRRLE